MISFKLPGNPELTIEPGGMVDVPCSWCGAAVRGRPAFADGALAIIVQVICGDCLHKEIERMASGAVKQNTPKDPG